jgi:hypothetical protein
MGGASARPRPFCDIRLTANRTRGHRVARLAPSTGSPASRRRCGGTARLHHEMHTVASERSAAPPHRRDSDGEPVGGLATASGAAGEDRHISGAGAGALLTSEQPAAPRTRELRLVELGEPAASPKGTRRRRKGLALGSGKDETPQPLMPPVVADHGSRTRPRRAGATGPPRGVL